MAASDPKPRSSHSGAATEGPPQVNAKVARIKMPEKKHHSESSAGAESSTLNVGPIVWFLLSLMVSTAIIFVLMTGLFDVFESRVRKREGKPSPLAHERERIAPEPRVQLAPSRIEQVEGKEGPDLQDDHPLVEMARIRRQESEKLNSYGWVDEKNGVVRIPIDDAKKLLLSRGLPIRKKQVAPNAASALMEAGTTESAGGPPQPQR